MIEVPLNQGYVALIDDESSDLVSEYNWFVQKNKSGVCYAYTKRSYMHIYMHRLIMNAPADKQVDHINHDGLDNQYRNLRLCNRSQNNANERMRGGTSQYRGVSYFRGKWKASIRYQYVQRIIGLYDTEIEAAKAYDEVAKEVFGEFARLNFN